MKKLILLLALLFTVSSAFISCRDTTNNPVEEGIDETGDAIENTADEVEDEL